MFGLKTINGIQKPGKLRAANKLLKLQMPHLDGIRHSLNNIRAEPQFQNANATAETIVNQHSGKGVKRNTFIDIHTYYNEQHVKRLIEKD